MRNHPCSMPGNFIILTGIPIEDLSAAASLPARAGKIQIHQCCEALFIFADPADNPVHLFPRTENQYIRLNIFEIAHYQLSISNF
jgi:hypothetical protein